MQVNSATRFDQYDGKQTGNFGNLFLIYHKLTPRSASGDNIQSGDNSVWVPMSAFCVDNDVYPLLDEVKNSVEMFA